MKKCPYCAEEIQDEAIKCKHCGEYLTTEHQDSWVPVEEEGNTDKFFGYVLEFMSFLGWLSLIVLISVIVFIFYIF